MEEEPTNQEQTPAPEPVKELQNIETDRQPSSPPPQEPEIKPPKKSRKWPWVIFFVLFIAITATSAWWLLLKDDGVTNQQGTEDTQSISEENKPFNNVLYY